MRNLDIVNRERRLTETMSETSESTTATSLSGKSSIDNAEELKDLALVLGIANVEDIMQERFRVDRRKLEQMLLGEIDFMLYVLLLRIYYCYCVFVRATRLYI